MSTKNRTSTKIIGYGLYLYFLGLSFRSTTKALSFLHIIKMSSCFHLEMATKIQTKKTSKEKENQRIHN
jgi:hypothetical protein